MPRLSHLILLGLMGVGCCVASVYANEVPAELLEVNSELSIEQSALVDPSEIAGTDLTAQDLQNLDAINRSPAVLGPATDEPVYFGN